MTRVAQLLYQVYTVLACLPNLHFTDPA